MKLLKGIGVVVGLLLLPVTLPIIAVVWGARTLWAAGPDTSNGRRAAAGGAIVAGLLMALAFWPALFSGDADVAPTTEASSSPSPSVPPTTPALSTPSSPSPAVSTPPTPSATQAPTPAPPATESPEPAPTSDVAAAGELLVPVVGIVDGDTIKVRIDGRTERVRVIGIDTPELSGDECYARRATSRMQSLAQSRSVRLEADPTQDDRDRYDRLLRHVMLADGRSAAEVLIAEGYGREYTYRRAYEGQAEYRSAENVARTQGLGLWGACPSAPEGVAAAPKETAAPAPAQAPADQAPANAGACDIKGNINSEGEKIYHVPGGRSYDKTRIDPSKGERMFCSESEARAAGWRAARG